VKNGEMAHPTELCSDGERTRLRLPSRRSLRWLPWLFGVAFLVAVITAGGHFSDARDFARLTQRAEPWWFALAIVLQVGTYR
jgi:hypothetical protein